MRVLYDLFWWTTGPVSGRVVARELLMAWRDRYPEDELILATRPRDRASVAEAFGGELRTVAVHGRPHGMATILQYPVLARRLRVDVVFTQNFAPPGTWSAIFVHDVMFQTNPEWFTRAERLYFWLIPRFARSADIVFTSSQNEAARIRACNPSLRRVEPVGLAVSNRLRQAVPVRPDAVPEALPFLLAVGRINIRKNLALTLDCALRSGRVRADQPLLVVASRDGRDEPLTRDVEQAVRDGRIRFLDYVSEAELAWLYANAQLFLYLSLDEGFGLPPLEALTFGCPAVVSEIPVFRELLGDHATYVDPLDADAVTTAIADARTERIEPLPEFPGWDGSAARIRDTDRAGAQPHL